MTGGDLRSPLPWLGALLALYLVVPLAGLAVHLAEHPGHLAPPGLWPALTTSVVTASVSTVVVAVLGVPLAAVLARARGRLARAVGVLVLLPLALPPLISGILLLSVVGPSTWLGRLTGGRLTDSLAGVVLAQVFVAAPFLVVAARSAFAAVPAALPDVAATLGLGPWARFRNVSLAVAWPGVAAGLLLAWLRAFGEFGATVILAYHPTTVPVFAYVQFSATGLDDTLGPAAVAAAAAAVLVVAATVVTGRRGRAAGPGRRDHPGHGARRRRTGPGAGRSAPPRTGPAGNGGADGGAPPLRFAVDRRLGELHLQVANVGQAPHVAVLGPSGAGKTTLLRALAGLLGPGDEIHVGERALATLRPERRRVGYVPQEPSLLPDRSLRRQLSMAPGASPAAVAGWLERVGLDGMADRSPTELSGGQRQRAALARALSTGPSLLLLDEPFAALDTPVRRELRAELRRLLADTPVSSVLVTHDPEEAAALADEILVVRGGRLLQAGRRADVFGRPRSPEVARLLGVRNVATGRLLADGRVAIGNVAIAGARVVGPRPPVGAPALWSVAPEAVRLGAGGIPGTVVDAADLGTAVEVTVEVAGGVRLVARERDVALPSVGGRCGVELPPGAVRVWRPDDVRDS